MSLLRQIEQSVTELFPEEFQQFTRWFEALQARRFDEQFERDATAGSLDDPAALALTERSRNKSTDRPLTGP